MKLSDYEYYRTELGTLYCGKWEKVIPRLRGEFDILNTDPPYNIGKIYDANKPSADRIPDKEYWRNYGEFLIALYSKMADRAILYVTSASYQIFKLKSIFKKYGYTWQQILIWYGPNMCGKSRRGGMPWSLSYEPVSMFTKGRRKKMVNAGHITNSHDVFIVPRPQSNYKFSRYHICQKPTELYVRLLSRTSGKRVLDPYGGSGTTAIACERLRREWVVIEELEENCKIIKKRLNGDFLFEKNQGDLGLK